MDLQVPGGARSRLWWGGSASGICRGTVRVRSASRPASSSLATAPSLSSLHPHPLCPRPQIPHCALLGPLSAQPAFSCPECPPRVQALWAGEGHGPGWLRQGAAPSAPAPPSPPRPGSPRGPYTEPTPVRLGYYLNDFRGKTWKHPRSQGEPPASISCVRKPVHCPGSEAAAWGGGSCPGGGPARTHHTKLLQPLRTPQGELTTAEGLSALVMQAVSSPFGGHVLSTVSAQGPPAAQGADPAQGTGFSLYPWEVTSQPYVLSVQGTTPRSAPSKVRNPQPKPLGSVSPLPQGGLEQPLECSLPGVGGWTLPPTEHSTRKVETPGGQPLPALFPGSSPTA